MAQGGLLLTDKGELILIGADQLSALDGSGLTLTDDAGNLGLTVKDGGAVRLPGQPFFYAKMSTAMTNLTINTAHTLEFDTVVSDPGSDFNTSTYTYTAPVDGYYSFHYSARIEDIDFALGYLLARINTSNKNFYYIYQWQPDSDIEYWTLKFSIITWMDANDTVYLSIEPWAGGANQLDVSAVDAYTQFRGWLLG